MKAKTEKQTTIDELRVLLERVRQQQLSEGDFQLIYRLIVLIVNLYEMLQKKRISIKEIKARFFIDEGSSSQTDKNKETSKQESEKQRADSEQQKAPETPVEKKPRAPGHGRNPAQAYTGAKKVYCEMEHLQSGSPCPDQQCQGHLYEFKRPAKFVRLEGQPLVGATLYEQQILKCSKCDLQCIAKLPAGVPPEKYAPSADAAIVLAKYGSGLPFNRLAKLQANFGVPLPASVQFERSETVANALFPIFLQMRILAARASVIYFDDTKVKIINCQPLKADKRKGIRTTAIVADLDDFRVALYVSGRDHAGDNVSDLLKNRPVELGIIIRMCDALKLNFTAVGEAIISICLVHGRRKFVDLKELHSEDCQPVLDVIGQVYANEARTQGLGPSERLLYHQLYSGHILEALKVWIEDRIEKRIVEPNSAVGSAYNYLLTHWSGLTQFLQTPKAPLDNNIVERALKLAVLQRKNSNYFRSDVGAFVSDVIMSILESCRLNGVEPFGYLVAAIENQRALRSSPEQWLPWVWATQNGQNQIAKQSQLTLRQSSGKDACFGFP
jgi:transposase